jgi:hypothetical protein
MPWNAQQEKILALFSSSFPNEKGRLVKDALSLPELVRG